MTMASHYGDVCKTFCDRATWTWNSLRHGIRTGIELGEESLTDINLLDIQLRHPAEIRTRKFDRVDEGRVSGADWEWWFGSKSGWLGLRIQAKKLNSSSLQYDTLDHHTKHGHQVDLLIGDAKKNSLVPMYCFYNYWDNDMLDEWKCGTFSPTRELQGCTVTNADHVKTLVSTNDKSLQSLLKRSLPWNCLICCRGYSTSDADLTMRASGVLRHFWGMDPEVLRIREEPPPHVADLVRREFEGRVPTEISHILIVTEGIL